MKRVIWTIGLVTVILCAAWVVRLATAFKANASTAQFNEDVENLFSALQTFKENVGTYPTGNNAQVVKALMGRNPKKLIILVGGQYDLNDKGEFVDPWGTPLRIYFDEGGVLVRSAGPNRRFDDSTVLENDDYYRSN